MITDLPEVRSVQQARGVLRTIDGMLDRLPAEPSSMKDRMLRARLDAFARGVRLMIDIVEESQPDNH